MFFVLFHLIVGLVKLFKHHGLFQMGRGEWSGYLTIATKFHNSYILKPPAFRKHILHGVFFKHFVFVFARTNSKVYPAPSSGDFSFKHLCGFVDFCGMATADSQHSKCPALKSSQK